jgi:thiol-disulfide isomerase/thioredoxin
MTDERQGGRPGLTILAVAAAAGLIAGSVAVYVKLSGHGNGDAAVAAACAGTSEAVERVKPLIKGDVAAFRVADRPESFADIAFKLPDGAETSLGAFEGRVVLLNLWATWCVPCRAEMPTLDRLEGELGGDDFEVAAVNIDLGSQERALGFLDEIGVDRLVVYSDPTTGLFTSLKRRGLAFGLPTTVLFDANGCRIGGVEGPAEWDSEDAKALIRAAIG